MNIDKKPQHCVVHQPSDRVVFTAAEKQTIDRRVAEFKPQFANSEDISKLFGKPFSA